MENPFTPAPQAPQFQQRNPLENMEQMIGVAQHAQALQQQKQMFDAQNALGELIQQHAGPDGEVDMHELLAKGASNPALKPIYNSLLKDALAADLTHAQILNSRFEAEQKRLAIQGNNAAGILEDAARTGKTEGLLADFVARNQAAGLYDGREGVKQLLSLLDAKKSGQSEVSMLRRGLTHSQLAQESIKNAGLDLKSLTAPTEYYDEASGMKMIAPAYKVPGVLSPGQQMQAPGAEGPQGVAQNAGAGGLAPPSASVRQGEPPLTPPAAPSGRLAEPPITRQHEEEARKPESAWGKLRAEVMDESAGATASQQAITETRGLVNDLQKLGNTGTGPTAKIRAQATKLLNEAEGMLRNEAEDSPLRQALAENLEKVSKVVSGSDDPKNWAGSAEALEKLGAITAIGGLRRAVGSANKVTQQEVMKFIDIFPGLTSSPGGIKRMLDYMEKVNKTLVDKQKFLNFYERENRSHRTKGYNPSVFNEEWNQIMEKSGAARFEHGE